MNKTINRKAESANRKSEKKIYRPPTLLEYGSVAKLTQNNVGSFNDSGSGMMVGSCL